MITGKYDSSCMSGLKHYFADFALEARETRGHRYKLKQRHCMYNIRQHYFISRSIPIWNGLPDSVVSAFFIRFFVPLLQWVARYGHFNAAAMSSFLCFCIFLFVLNIHCHWTSVSCFWESFHGRVYDASPALGLLAVLSGIWLKRPILVTGYRLTCQHAYWCATLVREVY